jgi:hypothetical protein
MIGASATSVRVLAPVGALPACPRLLPDLGWPVPEEDRIHGGAEFRVGVPAARAGCIQNIVWCVDIPSMFDEVGLDRGQLLDQLHGRQIGFRGPSCVPLWLGRA